MTWEELVDLYRLHEQRHIPNLAARYNVAPTQDVVAVRLDGEGTRKAAMFRWGLVPFWAKDMKIGYSTINARAETVADKPAFREAFKRRRCLIPANGYYEWTGPKGAKQPHYFTAADGGLLTFAGLWETWNDKASGERFETCTIIVTAANAFAGQWHDRMPVILEPETFEPWLACEAGAEILQPAQDGRLAAAPVSTQVNHVKNDSPDLVMPIQLSE